MTEAQAGAGAPSVTRGRLGLVRGSALYIAAVLGTGILVLPGLGADAAGPASILAVAAMLLLSIPLAGTFAALAARFPDAGGVATFVRLALGPTASRMAGYWFFFGVHLGAPVVFTLGAEYIVGALGGQRGIVPIIALVFMILPAAANWFGLHVSGSLQVFLSGLLVVIVVGVVALTAPAVEPSSFTPFLPHGWPGVGLAISLFIWAFAGWEAVTHISAEFKNPRRIIPIATAIAIVVVGAAYLALQIVTVGVPDRRSSDSPIPLIDLVAVALPGIGPIVIAVIAAIVAVGVMNIYIPAFANLAASLGRDGSLPKFFAKGAAAGEVPRRAIALTVLLELVYFAILYFGFNLDLEPFILVNTACMAAVYALGMVAAVRLLKRWSVGWWMGVVSTALVAGLLVLAGWYLVLAAALGLVAVLVTVVYRLRRKQVQNVAT